MTTTSGIDVPPGQPGPLASLAGALGSVGDDAEHVRTTTSALGTQTGPAVWRGPAADAFHAQLAGIEPGLARLSSSHHLASTAIRNYGRVVDIAQRDAIHARLDAERATSERDAAEQQRTRARAEAESHRSSAAQAEERTREADALRCTSPDPAYQSYLDSYQSDVARQAAEARAGQADAAQRETAAAATVEQAEARIAAARATAQEARARVEAAAKAAAHVLEGALPGGGPRRGLLEAAEAAAAGVIAGVVGGATAVVRGMHPTGHASGPRAWVDHPDAGDPLTRGVAVHAHLADAQGDATITTGPIRTVVHGEGTVGADASASGTVSTDGIAAAAAASAGAGGTLRAVTTAGPVEVTRQVEAFGGVKAGAGLSADKDGLNANAELFAGGKIAADVKTDVGGVAAGGRAEGWVGAGVEGHVTFGKGEDGKYHFGGKAGAALGLGGSVGGEITVDPKEIAGTVHDAADAVGRLDDTVEKGWHSAGKAVKHFL